MLDRNNTNNVALETLFEEFFNMMAEAKHVPFSDKLLLDEGDLSNIVEDLKEAIPREVSNASKVLEEQKNIINSAYADAERIGQEARTSAEHIVGAAQAEADALVQQEAIVQQANAVAEEIKANALHYQEELQAEAQQYQAEVRAEADAYALRVKQDALQYAQEMLVYLSGNLQSALQGLSENRISVESELYHLQNGDAQAEEAELPEEEQEG